METQVRAALMDPYIEQSSGIRDDDLMLCFGAGVAYQNDMTRRVSYDDRYAEKFEAYKEEISKHVNSGRIQFIINTLRRPDLPALRVLDYGCGDAAFLWTARASGINVRGFEIIPCCVEKLKAAQVYADDLSQFDVVTAWDVLEHLERPADILNQMQNGAILFASVPVFADLKCIRRSRHYRPGEHLYYWTRDGFVEWAGANGFILLRESRHEIIAGRDSIMAYAFEKVEA